MVSSFKAWLDQPFQSNMSAFKWFCFFGLLVVIATTWKLILGTLEDVT